jgi:hypothetical protein
VPGALAAAFTTWIRPSPYADIIRARPARCPPLHPTVLP